MRKYKTIKILILMLFILFVLSSNCFALDSWIGEAENFVKDGATSSGAVTEKGSTLDTDLLKEGSSTIYNAFFAIGTVVVIIVGAILGIQFMTAGIDEKVKVKQALFPYLISSIILFGSYGIWRLVIIIMDQID